MRTIFRMLVLGGSASVAVAVVAGVAAHVTANPGTAAANSFVKADFRVPHGCGESPTTALTIQIPAGVVSVKPENKPGWEVEVVSGTLSEPFESDGETITEGVLEVRWFGGSVPNETYEDFGISMRMPDSAGETIYFPVIQGCEEGETAWIEVPEPGEAEPEHPAPGIFLSEPAGDGHGGDDDMAVGAEATEDETPSDGLVWTAIVAGFVGLVAGTGGLIAGLRRK